MAQIATQLILGKTLEELGYTDGLYPESKQVHVKAPVFSFSKLARVDTYLGPEMKSTGEVMGTDQTLEKALYKAFEASNLHLPSYGSIVFTIADETKEEALKLAQRFVAIGYGIMATSGTANYFEREGLRIQRVNKLQEGEETIVDYLRSGKARAVINTIGKNRGKAKADGMNIRREAVEHGIPLFTALDTAKASLRVLESRSFYLEEM
jgi:carbamoyl-phosphate synthase large subunit